MTAPAVAEIMDGEALAAPLRAGMRAEIAAALASGALRRPPRLGMVVVGEDAASRAYLGRKADDCAGLGIDAQLLELPQGIASGALLAEVARLNADPGVDGFFVQFPLPAGHDPREVAAAIAPGKDVDGLGPESLGRLMTGMAGPRPCTPAAVLALLRHHLVPLAGREVLVVGRGLLTGRPLALMLGLPGVDAVVTLAHRAAPDLGRLTRRADVVISAAGVPGLIRADMLRPGATVIGVGISYGPGGTMVSDLAGDVAGVAAKLTPHHGSVGALTRAMLLRNLIDLGLRAQSPAPQDHPLPGAPPGKSGPAA